MPHHELLDLIITDIPEELQTPAREGHLSAVLIALDRVQNAAVGRRRAAHAVALREFNEALENL